MKVIQLVPELNAGGVERGILEIGQHLVKQGHESVVISNGERLVEPLVKHGSRHITLPVNKKRLNSRGQVKALQKIFTQEAPDVIHLNSAVPTALAYDAWQKLDIESRPKIITTVNGTELTKTQLKTVENSHLVICTAKAIEDHLLSKCNFSATNIINVVQPGVSALEFGYGYRPKPDWAAKFYWENPNLENKFLVTLPSATTSDKNQIAVLSLLSGLKRQCSDVHFLLVAEQSNEKSIYPKELVKAVKEEQIREYITLMGPRPDLREIMSVSNVVLSLGGAPTQFDYLTMKALKLGRPVAAYSTRLIDELMTTLFPQGKVEADSITAMTETLALLRDSESSPEQTNEYDLDLMVKNTVSLYQTLAG